MNKLHLILLILLALVVSIPASAKIVHRYPFDDDPNDVVGGLVSTLLSGATVSGGQLDLTGDADACLQLDAAGIAINSYGTTGLTLEGWVTVVSDQTWQRLFAFGESDGDPTVSGVASGGGNCLFCTTNSGDSTLRYVIQTGGLPSYQNGEEITDGPEIAITTPSVEHHIVCTYEPNVLGPDVQDYPAIALYQDGVLLDRELLDGITSEDGDATNTYLWGVSNHWAFLGNALYDDPELDGTINEFRIYDRALILPEVIFTGGRGPDNPDPIVLVNMDPPYDPPTDTDTGDDLDPELDIELSWEPESEYVDNIDFYTVYIGADPNIADPNHVTILSEWLTKGGYSTGASKLTNSHTIPDGTLWNRNESGSGFSGIYYWRVDTVLLDTTVIQGVPMSFRTLPEDPYFSTEPPAYTLKAGSATISAVSENNTSTQWYIVVGDPDIDDSGDTRLYVADDDITASGSSYSGDTTDDLSITITNVGDPPTHPEELTYYCVIDAETSSQPHPVASELARLVVPELKTRYEMEEIIPPAGTDPNYYVPDSGPADYDMRLESMYVEGSDFGQDYPSLEPNTIDGSDYSLFFNNTDSSDPNNAYGQYASAAPGVGEYEDITISAWVYWNGGGNWQRIIDFGTGTTDYTFLSVNTNGENGIARFAVRNNDAEQSVSAPEGSVPINKWTLVTATLKGNNARLFIDGDQVASGTINHNPTDYGTGTNNLIADSQWTGDEYFIGLMDDLRIYSYGMTPTEVAELYLGVMTDEYVCVEEDDVALAYDTNGDCRVDLTDISELADVWLDCERIPVDACGWVE